MGETLTKFKLNGINLNRKQKIQEKRAATIETDPLHDFDV